MRRTVCGSPHACRDAPPGRHSRACGVHAVNTISWAVRHDGPSQLARRLAGLSWQWIPYVSSGLPLALKLRSVISSSPDVLILANHGLVIGGESCEAGSGGSSS